MKFEDIEVGQHVLLKNDTIVMGYDSVGCPVILQLNAGTKVFVNAKFTGAVLELTDEKWDDVVVIEYNVKGDPEQISYGGIMGANFVDSVE